MEEIRPITIIPTAQNMHEKVNETHQLILLPQAPETQHVPIQNMKQSFVFSLTPSTRKQEAKATWQSQ